MRMQKKKKVHYKVALGACVARKRGLGFVNKGGYFCFVKTYVIGLNSEVHLTLKHNCPLKIDII